MTTDGYYRYPTIHKNQVVFVCEDDLWVVPARGGVARRLTANLSLVSHPAFSPDGKWLAFVGREEGETEVYIMPAAGGPARRLTYLGNSTTVLGWSPDGQKIVFASNVGQPFRQLTPLYTISAEGGQPEQLPYGPAHSVSFGPDGGILLGRRTQELANWKRYRGGRAGEVWVDAQGTGDFKVLLNLDSNMTHPMWLGERIFFLSDHEGIGNIYSCTFEGKDIQRHTHHEDYYTRQPRTDGQRIVYRAGADLYVLNPNQNEEQAARIKIKLHSPQTQRHRKFVKAANYLESYSLHPAGHSLTASARGKVFSMSNWEGSIFQYGEAHGARYRLPEWLNDGKRLVMVSDAKGEETLEIHVDAAYSPTERPVERLDGLDIGRPFFLLVSPRQDEVILANHRYELIHVSLQTKQLRVLDQSRYGRIAGADWSPDGRWVAYGLKESSHTCAIKLCQLETGETYYVTAPRNFHDINPTFDPGGRYLYFISYREFDPVYDSHYFDLNFPRGSRPYLVTLQQELPNPFVPRPFDPPPPPENGKKEEPAREPEAPPEKSEEEKKEGEATETPAEKPQGPEEWTLRIDLEDIQNRLLAFPVSEGRYHQVRGIKGKVYFTSYPIEGSLNASWHDSENDNKGALEYYDLAERRKEFVVSGVGNFDFSRNRNFLVYRSGKHLRVLKAGEKPDNAATGYNKKSGWINLDRLSLPINPPEEWQQMFREAWRLQRDHFWTEDMSRIDWQEVYKRYYKLIDRVSSRAEFSDLLWEMQGELGTSHAYELGGDYRTAPRYHQGELGADFIYDPDRDGYRITHVVRGDPWQERFNSPLNEVGVNARVGDVLLAIDGQRLSRTLSPGELLVNRTNTEVQLTFVSPDGAAPEDTAAKPELWTVLVKTLADDTPARYREWVETNRRQVHRETGDRIGYVHIPDMGPFGYAEFHRYYLSESEREGLIIDVRFNGGGNVSQLLLEKLARRRLGYKKPRYGEAYPYPSHTVLGPMVALTNEYAGSDGDIFSHVFKLMRLGKLLGKRTWGGVIGIWPRYSLVDGTLTTQPEFSSWFEDVGWAVENYGTDPDIEVDIRPQDYAQGKDPQLEQAIKEILKLLEENPPSLPDFGPMPSRSLPKLPKVKS